MATTEQEQMKSPSPRLALGISLAVIAASWSFRLFAQPSTPALPSDFSELVFRIVRDKLIVFVAIFGLLRLSGERFEQLGLHRKDWRSQLGIGLLIGLAMFIGLNVALNSLMNSLIPSSVPSTQSIAVFFKRPANLLLWLPIGIIGGGVVEELERIFIVTRFEKWLGRRGLIVGVVLSSVAFGVGHLYQGVGTAIATGVSGLVFALVYLRRRSALEAITAHAFSDVLAMMAATMLARA